MNTELAITRNIQRSGVLAAIKHADLAESTRQRYGRVIERYLDAGGDLFDADQLTAYAEGLSNSGRAFLKAAVRLLTDNLGDNLKAMATPENVNAVQASLYRIEALQNAVTTKPAKGQKAHTWLNAAQVKALLDSCGDDPKGERDRLALGLLVAAGLRRAEAVALTFADVKLQPVKGKMRTVLQVQGKGAKDRVVPISDNLANAIDKWAPVVGGDGPILRSVDQAGGIGDSLSAVGLFGIVRQHGAAIGKPELAPHDLRRTYTQLGYEAGVPVTQISKLLGHASIATTQRYLCLDLDLESTVSDFVPF